ncbi:MAG: hypothetical protein MUD13_01575 [Candidatus Nanopelagicales bacterium]|jgi:hypothetical protein|nr:hypothetical protein [Candidatus Nanopelagicales bacterium]
MTCRVVVGVGGGGPQEAVRTAVLAVAPPGSEVLPADTSLPAVVVVRIPLDAAPEELLASLRAIPGVAYAEQERMYEGFSGPE